MRLLEIHSDGEFDLVERGDDDLPRYAILSHTWLLRKGQEVTFKEMKSPVDSTIRGKLGYQKLLLCSRQAVADGLQFFWADTCCIDKASSAELSEAINSMFGWYRNATKCYAYLSDVSFDASKSGEAGYLHSQLKESRWFTRGWTLQELIAPGDVTVYDHEWKRIGTKKELLGPLSAITGIDSLALSHRCDLKELSVAKRLSWAARRETTRVEDRAYCLLGLLDVNMTLIYGEGEKAFMRLQDELLRTSDECSLLLWFRGMDTGILAPSPSHFAPCGKIVSVADSIVSNSWQMTHRGLRLTLPILSRGDGETYLGVLACRLEDHYTHVLAIHLRKHGQDDSLERPALLCSVQKCTTDCEFHSGCLEGYSGFHFVDFHRLNNATSTTVLIPLHNFRTFMGFSDLRFHQSVWIRERPHSFKPVEAFPPWQWNLETMTMNRYKRIPSEVGEDKQVGAVLFESGSGVQFVLCFAVSYKMQYIKIVPSGSESLQNICRDLEVTTSHQHLLNSVAVYQIPPVTITSRQFRASLAREIVMGEVVWVIDFPFM
ncbi:hypothetical protein G6011_03030 [Alternaria panax]|uniref:Heterokaryon incompatibility domain-containing protein n=1 Tax=Alternaria panax TaxID=48097 RepID=A0AAD4I450_9PLEO|nr:hypothetical protein G6011_03030 [Alternaria panax]